MTKTNAVPTYQEIVANRVFLKPGDEGYKGHIQCWGNPTPNPRIDRMNIRRLYRQVNRISFIHYPYADNSIVAKKGQVSGELIPGLLYSQDYVIIRQPNTRRMYALPYHIHQLAAIMGDMQIELYINEAGDDRKVIISGGNSEAMINDTDNQPAFIEINNCDPFDQNDGVAKLALAKPLMQYIAKKRQHYIAAAAGYGSQLVSDGYTSLHTGDWHYCRTDDSVKFDYVKGSAIEAVANISLATIQNMLPRYSIETRNELLLELTYGNNQMPLLIKNKQSQIFISQHGIDMKGDDGDIHMPPLCTIIPPRMKAPLLMLPSGFISDLAIIVSKSKKHVQDVLFRVYKHHESDHRTRYFIEVSGGEKITLTCIVGQLSNTEEEAARAAQAAAASQAQAQAQEEAEAAARQSGQEEREERERVIREEQERRAREEALAIEAARDAQAAQAAQERAAKLDNPLPADNYNDITPNFIAPSVLDEFEDTAIVPVSPITNPLPAVLEAKPATPTAIEVIEVIEAPKPKINYLQDEQALSSLLATLSQITGINVMLVGTWLWIDGDTKPVKEQLKQLGFRWHQKKVMWFMSLDQKYHKTRHNADWATIAMRYGVRTLKTND